MLTFQDLTYIVPRMKTHCGRIGAMRLAQRETLTVGWVQLALSNLDILNGVFLNAARSLSVGYQQPLQQQQYSNIAVQYKLLCVKFVIDAISSGSESRRLSDVIVAETLILAFDEVGTYLVALRHPCRFTHG